MGAGVESVRRLGLDPCRRRRAVRGGLGHRRERAQGQSQSGSSKQ